MLPRHGRLILLLILIAVAATIVLLFPIGGARRKMTGNRYIFLGDTDTKKIFLANLDDKLEKTEVEVRNRRCLSCAEDIRKLRQKMNNEVSAIIREENIPKFSFLSISRGMIISPMIISIADDEDVYIYFRSPTSMESESKTMVVKRKIPSSLINALLKLKSSIRNYSDLEYSLVNDGAMNLVFYINEEGGEVVNLGYFSDMNNVTAEALNEWNKVIEPIVDEFQDETVSDKYAKKVKIKEEEKAGVP